MFANPLLVTGIPPLVNQMLLSSREGGGAAAKGGGGSSAWLHMRRGDNGPGVAMSFAALVWALVIVFLLGGMVFGSMALVYGQAQTEQILRDEVKVLQSEIDIFGADPGGQISGRIRGRGRTGPGARSRGRGHAGAAARRRGLYRGRIPAGPGRGRLPGGRIR